MARLRLPYTTATVSRFGSVFTATAKRPSIPSVMADVRAASFGQLAAASSGADLRTAHVITESGY